MQQVAQPWVMLTISHSSFLVGLDSFAMNAPAWVLTLWGGALADRLDRKKVILFFQGIQFFAILLLVGLLALGQLQPWMLILISLTVGITDSLSTPSLQTIVPSLVSKGEIPKAISINSIQFNLARTLGPAIAGVVMAQFGALSCFGANAVSFVPFFLSIFWIYPSKGFPQNVNEQAGPSPSILATVQEVLRSEVIRTQLLAIFITTLFCSSLITFCPVLIKEVFEGQIQDFGFASTAFGVGGLAGAIGTLLFSRKFKTGTPGLLGFFMGVVVLATAFTRSLEVLLLLMFIGGVLLTVTNTAANSNVQLKATAHTRGKYSSLYQLSFRGGIALGGLLTGGMANHFGITRTLMINGVAAVVIHLLLMMSSHKHSLRPS